MARLWIVYREGLELLGCVKASVPLERAVPRLDIAPWRLFSTRPPAEVAAEQVEAHRGRKRALLEVREEDREELCGLIPGFFESPYSPHEALRRLDLG
ncbi:MAG: hypothetical protein ACREQ9_13520 [Candidatus Binatia bacterium]